MYTTNTCIMRRPTCTCTLIIIRLIRIDRQHLNLICLKDIKTCIDFLELCLDFEKANFYHDIKKNPKITNKSVFSIDFNAQTLRGDKSCFKKIIF